MMRILKHLRDFLDEEQLKWLPGNLHAGPFILLTQNKSEGEPKMFSKVIQVFDKSGTYIGCIENPEFIPNDK